MERIKVPTENGKMGIREIKWAKTKDYKGFSDAQADYQDMSEADIKRKDIDLLTQLNNDIANSVLQDLRNLNFDTIFKISELATFLPSLKRIINFFIIKISIHYE